SPGCENFSDREQVAKKPQPSRGMKPIASFSWQRSRSQLIATQDRRRWERLEQAASTLSDRPNQEKSNVPAREQDGVSRDMNFEIPKSNFDNADRTHLVADASQSHGSQPQQAGNTRFGFGTSDFVIYPAHGVGQILSIEEQTVAGASLEFFVI